MPSISGLGVAYVVAGTVLFWSGFKNNSIKDTITTFLGGKVPSDNPETAPAIGIADTSSGSSGTSGFATPAGSGSSSNGQAALQQAAKAYGWNTGAEWTALNAIEMQEAGYNPRIKNPTSGALGLAQALGHGGSGTGGSLGNEYGGYGLSTSEAQQANSGNAYWQAVWMVNYIHSTYGDPIKAEQFHLAHNYY